MRKLSVLPAGRLVRRPGQKESELTGKVAARGGKTENVRSAKGFVCKRVPHVTLKSIANNAEIDVVHDEYQAKLEPLRAALNQALDEQWEEWQIPREASDEWPSETKQLHAEWWQHRIARQQAIDASIAAKADYETPLRQALRGQQAGARGRAVHRREPVAASHVGRG